jgi:hypothetical protein
MAAHPERIPPQEAAYPLRALAGCSILRVLLASMVGESAEHLEEIHGVVTQVTGKTRTTISLSSARQTRRARHRRSVFGLTEHRPG